MYKEEKSKAKKAVAMAKGRAYENLYADWKQKKVKSSYADWLAEKQSRERCKAREGYKG